MAAKIGTLELVPDFVGQLLDLTLPLTCLQIHSLNDGIVLALRRVPGGVKIYFKTLTVEQRHAFENFCRRKGMVLLSEYLNLPWPIGAIAGCVIKGDHAEVSALIIEIFTTVLDAKNDKEFQFALM